MTAPEMAHESCSELTHERAADWLQRLDSPNLKEEELQSWLEWFGASDGNRKAFEELQSLRARLRHAPADYRAGLRRRLSLPSSPLPASGERVRVRGLVLSLAASLAIAAITLFVWRTVHRPPNAVVYSAPLGQHRTVALDDGSTVVLGADSTVTVTYSAVRRALDIRHGEAYFEVHRNATRPFVVEAGNVRVTAIGTAFNVIRDVNKVTVTVTDGAVEVLNTGAPSSPSRIAAGQRVALPLQALPGARIVVTGGSAMGWQEGRADFINAPLGEVLQFVNRSAGKSLTIDDPRVADLTYSGTILRDHLDEWIASLPRVYAIRIVPLQDGGIALVTRPVPSPLPRSGGEG